MTGIYAKAIAKHLQEDPLTESLDEIERKEYQSGGLWGIPSNDSKEYVNQIEAEELADLKKQLLEDDFDQDSVEYWFKYVGHSSEV
jgi:hypothetical protein